MVTGEGARKVPDPAAIALLRSSSSDLGVEADQELRIEPRGQRHLGSLDGAILIGQAGHRAATAARATAPALSPAGSTRTSGGRTRCSRRARRPTDATGAARHAAARIACAAGAISARLALLGVFRRRGATQGTRK